MGLALCLHRVKFARQVMEPLLLLCKLGAFRLVLLAFVDFAKDGAAAPAEESDRLYRHDNLPPILWRTTFDNYISVQTLYTIANTQETP
jgi:hypothetical protein